MSAIKVFIPLSKVDEEQRMVFGYASTEALDVQGEVISRAAIADALPDYMRFANIREMHQMSAVGVAAEASMTEKGLYVGAKVIDDAAWKKVTGGVYKGFSIGGRALEKADATITKMRLTEISLVDRPANPECVFDTWKADGALPEGAESDANDVADDAAADAGQAGEPAAASNGEPAAKGEGEPAAAAEGEPVAKGMWNVHRLVDALDSLAGTMRSAEYEAKQGEHSPEMVAALKAAVGNLSGVVKQYLGEEIALILAGPDGSAVAMGEQPGDVAKKGARYSKSTKEALSKVHGMLRECDKAMAAMGYDAEDEPEGNDTGKAEGADGGEGSPLAKGLDAETAEIVKAAGLPGVEEGALWGDVLKAALVEVAGLRKRNAELLEQPAPRKAAATTLHVIDKQQDTNGNESVAKAAEADPNDPLAVMKAALSRPRLIRVGATE